jgi:hypothetical protein
MFRNGATAKKSLPPSAKNGHGQAHLPNSDFVVRNLGKQKFQDTVDIST